MTQFFDITETVSPELDDVGLMLEFGIDREERLDLDPWELLREHARDLITNPNNRSLGCTIDDEALDNLAEVAEEEIDKIRIFVQEVMNTIARGPNNE